MIRLILITLLLVSGCSQHKVPLETSRHLLLANSPGGIHYYLDDKYNVSTEGVFLEAVFEYVLERGKWVYEEDINDCDNAAWDMVSHLSKQYACGFVVVKQEDGLMHAVVGYFNERYEFKLVEPQTGLPYTKKATIKYSLWP